MLAYDRVLENASGVLEKSWIFFVAIRVCLVFVFLVFLVFVYGGVVFVTTAYSIEFILVINHIVELRIALALSGPLLCHLPQNILFLEGKVSQIS